MRVFAITPASATSIRRHGQQNVGYSDNLIALLAQNCDAKNPGWWLEHKLWIKEGKSYRLLATYHTNDGWQGELTQEVRDYLSEAEDMVSLETYLKWIAGETMTRDLDHWSQSGVTTARQLADYLDGCVKRAIEKDRMAG